MRNSGAEGALECCADGSGLSGRVEHVAGAFAALLAHADVDHGQRERGGFHDAAGGVADQRIDLAEKAPVGDGVEVDEDVGIGRALQQGPVRSMSAWLPASALG